MSKVLQNAPVEHSAILSTCNKLPPVLNTFVLSTFEWPLKTGFTASVLYGHDREKTCLRYLETRKVSNQLQSSIGYNKFQRVNNKPTDQKGQARLVCAFVIHMYQITGPRSPVGNVSGYRCVSDCRSRGREFAPGPVPYFRED